jgi:Na+/proline symporter
VLRSPPRIGTVLQVMGVVLIVVGDLLYIGSHGRISAAVWLGLVGFGGCLALIGLGVAILRRRGSRRPR